eukprot:6417562-Ditylum_brightwellii.AAC.1
MKAHCSADWAALSSPTNTAAKSCHPQFLCSGAIHHCHGWYCHRLRSAVYPLQKVDCWGGGGCL